jgi:hypothetical protein
MRLPNELGMRPVRDGLRAYAQTTGLRRRFRTPAQSRALPRGLASPHVQPR